MRRALDMLSGLATEAALRALGRMPSGAGVALLRGELAAIDDVPLTAAELMEAGL